MKSEIIFRLLLTERDGETKVSEHTYSDHRDAARWAIKLNSSNYYRKVEIIEESSTRIPGEQQLPMEANS